LKRVKLGEYGEKIAREFLEEKGFKIIEKNYRYERAETDLIVVDEKNKLLAFVEVKTRRNKKFGEPEESVHYYKQEQLVKSSNGFLMNNTQYEEWEKRFDVMSIFIDGDKTTIKHIKNAF
jgi:putative endonuclease